MMVHLRKREDPVDLEVRAPPSKSYTHRALIAAALADGRSFIEDPLIAEDTLLTLQALKTLGVEITEQEGGIHIHGTRGDLRPGRPVTIDLKNSGTSMRLLASVSLLADHPVILTGSPRMCERPIGDLVEAINSIGGTVRYLGRPGYPPIEVSGRLLGGRVELPSGVSSQFITSLLMTAPYAEEPVEVKTGENPVSASYLGITTNLMKNFGINVDDRKPDLFQVPNTSEYISRRYSVEGDYSSASYFFGIGAICGGDVTVTNLKVSSPQGDRGFPAILEMMGCRVRSGETSVHLRMDGSLSGTEVNMSPMPDTVQTLSAVAVFADSPTEITGVAHLRHKESDRIEAIRRILTSLGAGVSTSGDAIRIQPGRLHGGVIDPENDHRTAMSGALLGLGIGDVSLLDAGCVGKSYPAFWDLLVEAGLWDGM